MEAVAVAGPTAAGPGRWPPAAAVGVWSGAMATLEVLWMLLTRDVRPDVRWRLQLPPRYDLLDEIGAIGGATRAPC